MAERSIIVIGAGIAGLAAGCYGRMNGYRTQIFEMHTLPGGLCTSWKRQGYTFDGCIHWLVGSRPRSGAHRIWEELGALEGRAIVDHEEFMRIEGVGGKTFIVYTNVDRLEQHLLELAPADVRPIRQFTAALRRCASLDSPGDSSAGLGRRLTGTARMLLFMWALWRWGRVSMHDFAARLHDPFLRQAFPLPFDLPDFPMAGALMTLAWMHNRNAGYPIGGSLAFAQAIERRYLALGGEVHYRSRVDQILVEGDRAVGVRLDDGTEHRADAVISAADGHTTLFHMLGGNYLNDTIRRYYDELPIFPPIIQVSLGLACDLSDEPHMISFPLETPIVIAGQAHARLQMRHYGYDPTLAPQGKSVVTVMIGSDYAFWKGLAQDRSRYEAEKQRIATEVITRLDRRLPGLAGRVEVVDVATPMTTERYTGNWQGSMEGWLITTRTIRMMFGGGMPKTLPGLEAFYMAGQWVEPGGGVPTAAQSGRSAIQRICRHDGRPFVTTTA